MGSIVVTRTPLPQRETTAGRHGPAAGADFTVRGQHVAPADVAPDMHDLAARVRSLMALQQGRILQLRLGGRFFDAVVTASGPEAYAVVDLMDEVQHVGGEQPDACGPVIEDPERNWLIWLVPPGTSDHWKPHRYGTCLGQPYELALPPITQTEPPGPYWYRPCRGDRLVPPGPLHEILNRFRPGPIPHEELLGNILSTIS
ncbi:hypothetical protein ABZ446_46045 [Streptomyces sp. NPDC005813]|uniref:hypothetical protein n=1 Tax=Streptomyces sp. NPDC005813 TaxID=3155592 RepID=UPI003400D1B6